MRPSQGHGDSREGAAGAYAPLASSLLPSANLVAGISGIAVYRVQHFLDVTRDPYVRKAALTIPSSPITKVLLTMPMYFRPYMLFSRYAP